MLRLVPASVAADRWLTLALLATATVGGLLLPAFTVSTGALIQALRMGEPVLGPLALVGGLFFFQRSLAPVRREISEVLWRKLDDHLAERVMAAMLKPPGLSHVEDPSVLDKVAQAQGALTGMTPGQALSQLGVIWTQRIQGILSLGIVWSYEWWAAILLGVAYVTVFRVARWHWLQGSLVLYGRTERLRQAYYLRTLALTARLAKEGRVFGLADWLVERYRANWLGVMVDIWRQRREGWLVGLGCAGLGMAAELLVLSRLASGGLEGTVPLGTVVTVAGAILTAGVLTLYLDGHWWVTEAVNSLDRVEELEEAARRTADSRSGQRAADGMPARAIRFEDVGFTYPGGARPVFEHLNLDFEAGRSLAIVGENGAGKTTLVKLLAGLYEPTEGGISVDGIDLRDLAPESWQRRISAVFQDFVAFELTAHDSVAFGAVHAEGDEQAVTRAAREAGALGIIERLPDGWGTPLSRAFSGGTQLSGGEWQRMALARALFGVAAGAGLLVLDEPTASLDVRGEAEVYQRFLDLTRGVTTIVISHRFSTVRRADRIVVLEHGHVVEDGTHQELLAAGGHYATMYRLQASRFNSGAGAPEPLVDSGAGAPEPLVEPAAVSDA